ncbi:hypothetical protein DFP72DRAFT_475291 [Ephemerocybe angulata]|uniref:F-box domain-containing protein n=1 Tax=Ephemerocybe angulata TaxID=980116 RepID=A0A8H6HRM9_9AGAR|nr:hypothetical protein DFP72DRAFT_475291 [Tulosesus angulatus]
MDQEANQEQLAEKLRMLWVAAGSPVGTPAERVPNELLSQIFCEGGSVVSTKRAKCTSVALTASRVCSRWRAVAIATPQIWTHIDLDNMTSFPHSTVLRRTWRFARMCVARTGSLPLSFTISEYLKSPLKALAGMGATSDRWASLFLFAHTLLEIVHDTESFSGFPNLEYLDVRVTSPPIPEGTVPFPVDRAMLPRMSRFNLQIARSPTQFACLAYMPRPSLTHLSLTLVNQDYLDILGDTLVDAHRLTHLHIEVQFEFEQMGIPSPSQLITFPSLTFLSIVAAQHPLWFILCRLRVPNLTHLRLRETEEPSNEANSQLTNVLFDHFLALCPTLEYLGTQRLPLDRSLALIKRCLPERVVLAHIFRGDHMRNSICRLLRRVVKGHGEVVNIREIVVYDGSASGAYLAEDLVYDLQDIPEPGSPTSPMTLERLQQGPQRMVVVYSASPIGRSAIECFKAMEAMFPTRVKLHYDTTRDLGLCEFPESEGLWSTGLESRLKTVG